MAKLDPFTSKRLVTFVADFRSKTGTAPTLKDLENAGFDSTLIDHAVRSKILDRLYVTLTNGTIVKTYVISAK